MSSHVSPMRATILIPEPRDAAPLHSARATNAAAYHLYLNVTRLLERWRTVVPLYLSRGIHLYF